MTTDLSVAHLFDVKELVVCITGGGSGLGSYAARALAANGAKAVYIVGRREEALKKIAADYPSVIKPLVGDVTDKASLLAVADTVRKEQGYINCLFANAGVTGPQMWDLMPGTKFAGSERPEISKLQSAMMNSSMEDFTNTFHVNCTAVFFTAMAFLDLLDAGNKRGNVPQSSQILITTSIAGFTRVLGVGFPYSMSKAATTHLMKMLTTYFVQYNIRANVIAPGLYPSDMTGDILGPMESHKNVNNAFAGAKNIPRSMANSGRTGSEQDFASLILFMCSPAGAYLDGMAMVTDGGRLSQGPAVY